MNFFTKKLNKKGFTLAELLIVVAIIAILVAIAIPIFTNQLNKARISRDEANVRSAKAEAINWLLSDDTDAVAALAAGTETTVYTFEVAFEKNTGAAGIKYVTSSTKPLADDLAADGKLEYVDDNTAYNYHIEITQNQVAK